MASGTNASTGQGTPTDVKSLLATPGFQNAEPKDQTEMLRRTYMIQSLTAPPPDPGSFGPGGMFHRGFVGGASMPGAMSTTSEEYKAHIGAPTPNGVRALPGEAQTPMLDAHAAWNNQVREKPLESSVPTQTTVDGWNEKFGLTNDMTPEQRREILGGFVANRLASPRPAPGVVTQMETTDGQILGQRLNSNGRVAADGEWNGQTIYGNTQPGRVTDYKTSLVNPTPNYVEKNGPDITGAPSLSTPVPVASSNVFDALTRANRGDGGNLMRPMIGKDGKPVVGADGKPVMEQVPDAIVTKLSSGVRQISGAYGSGYAR